MMITRVNLWLGSFALAVDDEMKRADTFFAAYKMLSFALLAHINYRLCKIDYVNGGWVIIAKDFIFS